MLDIVWEVSSGRCMRTINVGGVVRSIGWCPNKALSLVAVAADRKLLLINPGVGDILVVKKTDSLLRDAAEQPFTGLYHSHYHAYPNGSPSFCQITKHQFPLFAVSDKVKNVVQWQEPTTDEWDNGLRIVINHFKEIKQVCEID